MEELFYKNAPIIEAIIDIRAAASSSLNVATFKEFADDLKSNYSQSMSLYSHQFTFNALSPAQIETKGEVTGIRILSNDEKRVVIVNREGFAFSHLAPYENWAKFREDAEQVWSAYLKHLQPQIFSRVALRYLNLFRFSEDNLSLPRYFTIFPHLEAINSKFSQHELRVKIELNEASAVITQKQLPAQDGIQILLDIDVFKESGLPMNSSEIWDCLSPLRDHKNRLFRQCLTYEGERRIRE